MCRERGRSAPLEGGRRKGKGRAEAGSANRTNRFIISKFNVVMSIFEDTKCSSDKGKKKKKQDIGGK